MSHNTAVLLLGSNIGDKNQNIAIAKTKIENNIGAILKISEILETKPIEFCSFNYFLNFALRIKTPLSPFKLLQAAKKIEFEMGRTEDSTKKGAYSDRIIDIDIVTFNNLSFESDKLKIPHLKHLYEREFSRILLKEVE